ncbi:MAG: hypothetical protein GX987_03190 [Tissierellia bacterium]|nr:hypothetical protein [Tissierellia bacterium]
MKRLFKFGEFSGDSICKGIFITSFLLLFRMLYFTRVGMSIYDSNIKIFITKIIFFYVGYLEPIVVIIWLKFICEFLFKLLNRDKV